MKRETIAALICQRKIGRVMEQVQLRSYKPELELPTAAQLENDDTFVPLTLEEYLSLTTREFTVRELDYIFNNWTLKPTEKETSNV